MAVERSELLLLWPAPLFAHEARALLEAEADDDALAGLLAEAFHGGRGEALLKQTAEAHPHRSWVMDDPWAETNGYRVPEPEPFASRATAQLVAELAASADGLARHILRRLYRQRQRAQTHNPHTVAESRERFARLLVELAGLGYFADAFGSDCPDSGDSPNEEGQRYLAERLELPNTRLWPPAQIRANVFESSANASHVAWPDEVFFEVIEALDELVARPRQRHWHSYHQEWDYSNYSRPAGQAVYRWRINQLLDESEVPLRLAETGSDAGLLVHATRDPRDELTDRVLSTPDTQDRAEAQHAVEMFRAREVTREQKRSAIITLARLLEERRTQVEALLTKKDAGALFQIANEFDLRHRGATRHGRTQRADYDGAFLDWIYWWYLATVELTDQLASSNPLSG